MITYTFNWIKIKMQAFFKVHYQNCINETGQPLALSLLKIITGGYFSSIKNFNFKNIGNSFCLILLTSTHGVELPVLVT